MMRLLKSDAALGRFLAAESAALVRIGAAWDRTYDKKLDRELTLFERDLGLAIAVATIDVEDCETFAREIGLLNVPAMAFVVRGKVVAVEFGVRPAETIRALVLKHLLGKSAL